MTEKQLEQVKKQLPEGEYFNREYRAIEGDIRIISKDASNREKRYTVSFDVAGNALITLFH